MFADIQKTLQLKETDAGWHVHCDFYEEYSPRAAIAKYMEYHDLYGTRSFKDVDSGKLYIAYVNADHYAEVIELFVN